MSFFQSFKKLPIEKLKSGTRVSSNPAYDKIILEEMTNELRNFLLSKRIMNIVVRPSIGQGNYADVPWICLLSNNPSISPSPQKGLYIVLLFHLDGESFYLTLGQGITNFNQKKISNKQRDDLIRKTVQYFQKEIDKKLLNMYTFSTETIDLGPNPKELAKGYIKTAIISKRYYLETFNQDDFYNSLNALIHEYSIILEHIGSKSYDDIIELINPTSGIELADDALESISFVLKEEFIDYRDMELIPVKVEKGAKRSDKYGKLSQQRVFKKTDYIKQAKENLQTGLKGEEIALKLEQDRLINLGLDPNLYLKWVSVESDTYGYDFESVEYIDGELKKMFIEVKASKDLNDTPFFLSKNELEVSRIKKSQYRVFRIFDITSTRPKYYVADGEIEENFYLDPVTYQARYKYDIMH
jgi:hypothetical protein